MCCITYYPMDDFEEVQNQFRLEKLENLTAYMVAYKINFLRPLDKRKDSTILLDIRKIA